MCKIIPFSDVNIDGMVTEISHCLGRTEPGPLRQSADHPVVGETEDGQAGAGLAGDQGRQLLDTDRLLGVQEIIHPERVLTRGRPTGLAGGRLRFVVVSALFGVLIVPHGGGHPGLGHPFTVLVQDADRAVLPDPVAHLQGVNPHGELAGEGGVKEGAGEPAGLARLSYHRVHLAIDANATIPGALERLLGEPVVTIPALEDLDEAVAKFLQLGLADIAFCQPYQVDQKIGSRQQLKFHDFSVVSHFFNLVLAVFDSFRDWQSSLAGCGSLCQVSSG